MPERQPLHMKVGDLMRADITTGAYVGALPSMDELGRRFGISRVTMRNALKLLEEEGLVRIRQGSGTFVNVPAETQDHAIRNSTSELPSTFAEAIGRYTQFLTNYQIPREVRARMMQIIDTQIGLVEEIQQPETKEKA